VPNLWNAQGVVNLQAIQRTMGDVRFDGQIGRRISAQIQPPPAGHPGRVFDPKTIVRLQAAQLATPAHGNRTAAYDRQPQLLR